jgi:hypothetical protein
MTFSLEANSFKAFSKFEISAESPIFELNGVLIESCNSANKLAKNTSVVTLLSNF